MKAAALAGIRWTAISTGVVNLLHLLQLAVLARLLNPTDFGLMAVVLVIVGFVQIFGDMGIGNAIIHRQVISQRQLSSLYWVNISTGIALTLVVLLVGPFVAQFYNEPRLANLIILIAPVFSITAAGNLYRILLQKDLRFGSLAIAEIAAAMMSTIVSISFALGGAGVYSLVWATLSLRGIATVMFLLIGFRRYQRPSFIYQHDDIKSFVHFGLFQMGEGVINQLRSEIDIILISKLFGPETCGSYQIAKSITMRIYGTINSIVNRVAFPIMASKQDDKGKVKAAYCESVQYLCYCVFPILMSICLLSDQVVALFLGDKWGLSPPYLKVLAIQAMIYTAINPVGSLVLACGRADLPFYWNLVVAVLTLGVAITGSAWGSLGIPVSILLFWAFAIIPCWFFLVRPLIPARLSEFGWAMGKPLCLVLAASVCGSPFLFMATGLISNIGFLVVAGMAYLALLFYFGADFLKTIFSLLSIR